MLLDGGKQQFFQRIKVFFFAQGILQHVAHEGQLLFILRHEAQGFGQYLGLVLALGVEPNQLRSVFGVVFGQGTAAQVGALGPLRQLAAAKLGGHWQHLRGRELGQHFLPLLLGGGGIAGGGVHAAQRHAHARIFGPQLHGLFGQLFGLLVALQGL